MFTSTSLDGQVVLVAVDEQVSFGWKALEVLRQANKNVEYRAND
jgi:hypothetical protein